MEKIQIPLPNTFAFTTDIEVRIDDINYGQHLGHDALIRLLHQARMRYLLKNGYSELNIEGKGMLVRDLTVHYQAEVFFGETLRVSMAWQPRSKTSITLLYKVGKISKQPIICASAAFTFVFIDLKTRKPVAVPALFK